MLDPKIPALILAPMDGLTDAPMRAVQGDIGAFTFSVAEFVRISVNVPSKQVFHREVPELLNGGRTTNGLPVHVQLLGGHAGRMAEAAVVACEAGAKAIDINFGCPSPTVNGHDGGASLLRHPLRIREVVAAIRDAVPQGDSRIGEAAARLGFHPRIFTTNAEMAAEGGASPPDNPRPAPASKAYKPPVFWKPIGIVREAPADSRWSRTATSGRWNRSVCARKRPAASITCSAAARSPTTGSPTRSRRSLVLGRSASSPASPRRYRSPNGVGMKLNLLAWR